MINEEDHLRIQVLREGLSLKEAAETADRIDTLAQRDAGFRLRQRIRLPDPMPHQPGHGPAGLGDASPARLDGKRRHAPGCPPTFPSWGLPCGAHTARGAKSPAPCTSFPTRLPWALSESEAVENLRAITVQLMEEERKARSQMSENIAWQDKIDRAAGILKTARVLSSSECMEAAFLYTPGPFHRCAPGRHHTGAERFDGQRPARHTDGQGPANNWTKTNAISSGHRWPGRPARRLRSDRL